MSNHRDSNQRERKPRRPGSDRNGNHPQAGATLREIEKQMRQMSRAFDGLARGFNQLGELFGELELPAHDGNHGAQPSEPDSQRLQPAAELPGAPQASTLALEQALTTSVDEEAKDYLTEAVELFEEADRGIPELRDYSMRARSAYLAIWAGKGRALQSSLEPWWDKLPEGVEKSFRVFFGKLTTVTKRLRCEWVDALHRAWSTDWDIYVAFYQRRLTEELPGTEFDVEELELEEDQMLARDRLGGLLQRNRPRPSDARQLILEASDVLDGADEVMSRVLEQYRGLLRGHEDFLELLQEAGLDPEADPDEAETAIA